MNFSKPTAADFKLRSSKILGVFTKTKEDLIKCNADQLHYKMEVEDKIADLEHERSSVDASISENDSIIKKIEEFLS